MSTEKYSIDALSELGNLDEKGKPEKSRLKDVNSALSIFRSLQKADEASSINRSRVDSMFDGASPYDSKRLNASGQGLKTNLNFGEAQRLLDISLSAYVDLYSSLETLVEVRGTQGQRSEIKTQEDIVSEELTHMLRSWPEFHNSYLRLCTTFVKHGTGVAYFDTPDDWKFRVGSFADILIPRQTPADENFVDIAIGRRQYHLHELFGFIKNEKAAKSVGWDIAEVKRVIMENVTTQGRTGMNYTSDWESYQAELKNNDLYHSYQNPTVSVLHFWVREMDGSVSHFICAEDKPKKFMYEKISRYEKPEQAFVMFTYGVGSNGTYHSIRGLGHRIFNHIQTSNRLRCQMIDGAMLGSAVMIQPENQRALDELSFTYYGAYAVLSPNVNIIEKAVPNLSTAVQPALNDITNQLALNTDTVSTYGSQQSSPYRNKMQVVADMDVATRLSGASLNLFYASWTRLMKEIVRRVVENKRRDGAVKEFYDRCAVRGVQESFIKTLDISRTKAVRSIGSGSQANRFTALRELQAVSGQFDETGRKNLTRDIVATRVGHDLADRYMPQQEQERPTIDLKIAYFENQDMMEGKPVPVVPNELHATHLQVHLPTLNQLLQQLDEGVADPVQAFPALQAFYDHVSQTVQALAGDPMQKLLVGEAKQVLNFTQEMIYNTSQKIEKMKREQAEAGGQEQSGDAAMAAKMREAEVKNKIALDKAKLDMEIKQAEFEQDLAIRDAKNARELSEQS
tara:strand:+ start:816 stop:3032 length:2217 start_codon:yes stop_codon:yes gene_type:complete